jgi:poly(A) polymerase
MHETSTKRPTLPHTHDADDESWSRDGDRARGVPPGLALDPPEEPPPHAPEIPVERLDPDALKVIARLRHMRHQAYLVGGCVRDLLLDRTPKDFDVATDAHPGEVRAIFRNCRLIGRRFRLAHVYFRGGKVVEVATFRKNPVDVGEDVPDAGDLLITRDNVFGTAEEDAVRRDFTVNGLFYDVARG